MIIVRAAEGTMTRDSRDDKGRRSEEAVKKRRAFRKNESHFDKLVTGDTSADFKSPVKINGLLAIYIDYKQNIEKRIYHHHRYEAN